MYVHSNNQIQNRYSSCMSLGMVKNKKLMEPISNIHLSCTQRQGSRTSGISEPLYEYVLQDVDDSESLADLLKQKLSEKTVDEIQLAQHSRIKEFREKMKSMFDSGKIRK